MFRWLAIPLLCFILPGCTIAFIPFFRNYTNAPVEIWFKPRDESYLQNYKTVRSTNEILEIRGSTYSRLKDSLPIIFHDRSNASVAVPAHSTIHVPRWITNDSVIVLKQGKISDTIRLYHDSKTGKGFRYKSSGFPVKSIYYYDYK